MKIKIIGVFLLLLGLASCTALKPWERVYVDDPEMQPDISGCKQFEKYVHSIREGATPAGGSKSSGGCGCN